MGIICFDINKNICRFHKIKTHRALGSLKIWSWVLRCSDLALDSSMELASCRFGRGFSPIQDQERERRLLLLVRQGLLICSEVVGWSRVNRLSRGGVLSCSYMFWSINQFMAFALWFFSQPKNCFLFDLSP